MTTLTRLQRKYLEINFIADEKFKVNLRKVNSNQGYAVCF